MHEPPSPYAEPENPFAYKKRGVGIWIIFYLEAFGLLFSIVSQYQVSKGYYFLPEDQRALVDRAAPYMLLMWLIRLVSVAAAIRLVMLRKDAYYLFIAAFVLSTAWDISALTFLNLSAPGSSLASQVAISVFSKLISLAIIFYVRSKRRLLR